MRMSLIVVEPQHLSSLVMASVIMVPLGRAQPLAAPPDSVRAPARREPPPPWAPPPRVLSEFCQICHVCI